jgi:hypothetical protein
MPKKEAPCGELLQGKNGTEAIIILNGDIPIKCLHEVFSGEFELEVPAPWDDAWLLMPKEICRNGCDLRSFAMDMEASGISMIIPLELPDAPTFQEVFGI